MAKKTLNKNCKINTRFLRTFFHIQQLGDKLGLMKHIVEQTIQLKECTTFPTNSHFFTNFSLNAVIFKNKNQEMILNEIN